MVNTFTQKIGSLKGQSNEIMESHGSFQRIDQSFFVISPNYAEVVSFKITNLAALP